MSILTKKEGFITPTAVSGDAKPQEADKIPSKWSIWKSIAMLGIIAGLCAAQIEPLFMVNMPARERIRLAEESVKKFRDEQISLGEYAATRALMAPEILSGTRRLMFYTEQKPYVGTGSAVDSYIDSEGYLHQITLTNTHLIPPDPMENTVKIVTDNGIYSGNATCLPYDYIGKDLSKIDPQAPIRDLALCDIRIVQSPTDKPIDITPIPLNLFETKSKFSTGEEYFGYGFSIDGSNLNEKLVLADRNGSLVSRLTYLPVLGDTPFFGEPAGPGNSGGVLTNGQKIFGIMSAYRVPKLTYLIDDITGHNLGNILWRVEPIPQDIQTIVATFKKLAQTRTIPERLKNQDFNYIIPEAKE